MALSVELVTPPKIASMHDAHAAVTAGFAAEFYCTGYSEYPSIQWLTACVHESPPFHEIAIAHDGSIVGGFVVVHLSNQQILAICYNKNQTQYDYFDVATALCSWVKGRYGVAWGTVGNADLLTNMTSSGHGFRQITPDRLEWE